MLILTRKPGESLYIGDVKVTIVELKGHQIRIGIDAPPEIRIYREEIYLQIIEENKLAAQGAVPEGSLDSLVSAWQGSKKDLPRKGNTPAFQGDSGEKKRRLAPPAFSAQPSPGSPEIIVRKKKKNFDE